LKTQPAAGNALHCNSLVSLTESQRREILTTLSEEDAQALLYDWEFWARPKQLLPPGDWTTWLNLGGRGVGKTRVGSETVRIWARSNPMVNLVGATIDDARDIMIEGESGILAVCPPHERPEYQVSKRRLSWPNGGKSLIFTADEPERLRGKQHTQLWCDEVAAWRYPAAWDQARLGLRLGAKPQTVVTTTPRPSKLIKDLMADPSTIVTHATTYENRANLAPEFFSQIIRKYEGTRLGRQELLAEILDDNPGALWKRSDIEATRLTDCPELARIVVAVDPAGSISEEANDTGIIVAGLGANGHGYILDDLSLHDTPHQWGSQAVSAYGKWRADRIVGEDNFGGQMVEFTIRTVDPNVSYRNVHASRGKVLRAEPIAALYEQGRVHHVGMFPELEDQLCQWEPGMKSPDRLDALVWALSDLMLAASVESGTIKYA
jgi:phage terminase large subunit-like protein